MLPSIKHGDRLEVLKLDEKTRTTIARGDIIAYLSPMDRSKFYVKRVIALPGDNVEITNGEVWLNGEKLKESYVNPRFNTSERSLPPLTVPPHAYYVLGDNRDNSADSRIWGPVADDLITGKVLRKLN